MFKPSLSYLLYAGLRSALFRMDAEHTHELSLRILSRLGQNTSASTLSQKRLADPVRLAGLDFPNRVGLAAGLDKNATAIDGFGRMGFGFIEVGTVTPLMQSGNPKPRLFRLPEAEGIINRMGFNNVGLESFCQNVMRTHFQESGGILGVNIGKNAATPMQDAGNDYIRGMVSVYPLADYISINISSPNTANLRDLQNKTELNSLLSSLSLEREKLLLQHNKRVPLFLKIAPDLDEAQIEHIAQCLIENQFDGVIACNTLLDKSAVAHLRYGQEQGGLSGKPVRAASNRVLTHLRSCLGPDFPIIGVGGIFSAEDALAKIKAGANLVQIYTGLIYRGPGLVREIAQALKEERTRTKPKPTYF